MNWIKCSERLPEEAKEYLVFSGYSVYSVVNYSPKHRKWNCFDHCSADRDTGFHDVTHWMPLPEPPKEGE